MKTELILNERVDRSAELLVLLKRFPGIQQGRVEALSS